LIVKFATSEQRLPYIYIIVDALDTGRQDEDQQDGKHYTEK